MLTPQGLCIPADSTPISRNAEYKLKEFEELPSVKFFRKVSTLCMSLVDFCNFFYLLRQSDRSTIYKPQLYDKDHSLL